MPLPFIATGLPRAMAVTAVAAAALTVTGCERPAPSVTVFTGDTSMRAEAACWAAEADGVQTEECAADILTTEGNLGDRILFANSDDTVGISVDPDVAEAGWIVRVAGQPLMTQPLRESYFRFPMPFGAPEEGFPMQVVSGADSEVKGVWLFRLVPNQP